MSNSDPKLFILCGKICAGKSTLASELSSEESTILFSQDHWNSTLYPNEISTIEDYVRCSGRVRKLITPLVVSLLQEGLSVVMDFPANTIEERKWLRSLFETANADHELHFLDYTDEICKERLHQRNESGNHQYEVSDEQFDLFTSYFVAPMPEEGFNIQVHSS